MKKYLLWKKELQPSMVAPGCLHLPTISADVAEAQGLGSLASPVLSPMTPSINYGALMCSPVLLERLGPHILRSHTSTAQFKAIPNNDQVDLEGFRHKDPQEWGTDDVIAWMISVARKHQIPVEDMNMHRFSHCSGPLLILMNQQSFMERDNVYGYLLYMEFRKLVGDEANFLDDWMRVYRDEGPSLSTPEEAVGDLEPGPSTVGPLDSYALAQSQLSLHRRATLLKGMTHKAKKFGKALQKHPEFEQGLIPNGLPPPDDCSLDSGPGPSHLDAKFVNKTRKNKDGKPRKRSQHNKGNKLWEFIRDALKDPATCPSVVRWEDPKEGVFRIVESEKLARLWGEKKNNQKMTYEKLSRAMRTYYEKQILVPVPKTGLYPKKLVYKFGPQASGWSSGRTGAIEDEEREDVDVDGEDSDADL